MATIVIGAAESDGACSIAMTAHFRSLIKDLPTLVRGYSHRGIASIEFHLMKDVAWADTYLEAPRGSVCRHFKKAPPGGESKPGKILPTIMRVELKNGFLELTFQNKSNKLTTKPVRIADFEAILKRFLTVAP